MAKTANDNMAPFGDTSIWVHMTMKVSDTGVVPVENGVRVLYLVFSLPCVAVIRLLCVSFLGGVSPDLASKQKFSLKDYIAQCDLE